MKTPKVLEVGRAHFGCDAMTSVLLEDEGGSGSQNSHWERTFLGDECLTAS